MTAQPLRGYQIRAISEARGAYREGKRALLFVLPTGGGKTRIIVEMTAGALAKGNAVMVMAHRDELLDQARARLAAEGIVRVDMISPRFSRDPDAPVKVASTATLLAMARRGAVLPRVAVLVLDEAHHYAAAEFRKLVAAVGAPLVLGFTATPERADGLAMGDVFDALIAPTSIADLTASGVLVPATVYAPPTPTKDLSADPVAFYQAHAPGERAFVFAVNVAHAETLAARFNAAGIPAACIHGDTPERLREEHLDAFRAGRLLVLTNVAVLTEGVDVPEASCAILARGFGSVVDFLQAIGRVLRAAEGKARAVIGDLRGASHIHGTPDEERVYSLDGDAITLKRKRKKKLPSCAKCGAVFSRWGTTPDGDRRCPECGAVTVLEPERVVERPLSASGSGATREERGEELRRLARTCAAHGYKPGWIGYRYQQRFGAWPPRRAVERALAAASAESERAA